MCHLEFKLHVVIEEKTSSLHFIGDVCKTVVYVKTRLKRGTYR